MTDLCVYVHNIMWLCVLCIFGNSLSNCLQFCWVFKVLLALQERARLDGAVCTLQYFRTCCFVYFDLLTNVLCNGFDGKTNMNEISNH